MARSLKKQRAYVKGLITRANKKIQKLIEEDAFDDSFAVHLAKKTQSAAKNVDYGDELFSITGMRSKKELDREKGRILAFLGDTTSNPEAAKKEAAAMTANTRWGGAFFAKGLDGRVDESRARADYLSLAAEAYRRLASDWPHLLGGTKGFESSTMINILYDRVNTIMKGRTPFLTDEQREGFVKKVQDYGDGYMQLFEKKLIKGNFASGDVNVGKLSKKRRSRYDRRR